MLKERIRRKRTLTIGVHPYEVETKTKNKSMVWDIRRVVIFEEERGLPILGAVGNVGYILFLVPGGSFRTCLLQDDTLSPMLLLFVIFHTQNAKKASQKSFKC